jgi:hypothetical protein
LCSSLEDDQPVQEFTVAKGLTNSLRGLCDTLTSFLQCTELHAPALLAGDWGSGKTSLLYALKEKLENTYVEQDFLNKKPSKKYKTSSVLIFETWIYQHEDNLFQILCATFLDQVSKRLAEDHFLGEQKQKLVDVGKHILKSAGVIGAKGLKGFLAKQLGREFMDAVDAVTISKEADQMAKSVAEEVFEFQSAAYELQNAFLELLEFWKSDRAPIILVDDLDRCPPDRAIDLLDAIRTLLSVLSNVRGEDAKKIKGKIPQFLVALDRDMMVDAISKKFEGIESFDGNRYLEKVFPYCFYVPTGLKEDAVDLLKKLVNSNQNGKDLFSQNGKSALQQVLSQEFFANPRLIKRTYNRYILFRFALKSRQENQISGASDYLEFEKKIITWIAACERWPVLRTILQRRREIYWKEMANAVEEHDQAKLPGPLAKKLIMQQAALAWLKQESILDDHDIRQSYREVDDALRKYGL